MLGCQPASPLATSQTAAADTPQFASTTCEANVPTPIPSSSGVEADVVVAANGRESIPGLDVSADGAALNPPVAHLYVQAYPGSAQVRVAAAYVVFSTDYTSTASILATATVPIDPVTVPAAPQGGGYGATVEVSAPLPAGLLKPYFAQLHAKGQPLPSSVYTQVHLEDDNGNPVPEPEWAQAPFAFDLPTGSAGTTAAPALSPCTTDPSPQPPGPVIGANGATVQVADEVSFSPKDGLLLTNGALSGTSVSVTLAAAPGSAAVPISAVEVNYQWTGSDKQAHQNEIPAFQQVATLPAGTLSTPGAPVTINVPLAATGLGNLNGAGLVVAHLSFVGKDGMVIQDRMAAPLDVQVPILVK